MIPTFKSWLQQQLLFYYTRNDTHACHLGNPLYSTTQYLLFILCLRIYIL